MDKQQLRRDLLAGMCRCAEEISLYHNATPLLTNVYFLDRCPVAFKPGVGDRYLFNLIVNKVIDNITLEEKHIKYSNKDIMGKFYYPQYGRFDKKELEEAREQR